MKFLTWNANYVGRWDSLLADTQFTAGAWDAIFLQELGNPPDDWKKIWGPDRGYKTNASVVTRLYEWPDALTSGGSVFVAHGEWPGHKRCHLAIILKSPTDWAADCSADQSERPVLGITCRFEWNDSHTEVLLGCVHIIASGKAPAEVRALIPSVEMMVKVKHCHRWVLVGDFNCSAGALKSELQNARPNVVTSTPGFFTLKTQQDFPIDYLVASDADVIESFHDEWTPGGPESDHRSAYCDQFGGPKLIVH